MRDSVSGGALTETTLFMLLAFTTPNHGYGVMQWVKAETDGRVIIGAGTMYGAVNKFLKKGWIVPAKDTYTEKKKKYILTIKGYEAVNTDLNRLKNIYEVGSKKISEYER